MVIDGSHFLGLVSGAAVTDLPYRKCYYVNSIVMTNVWGINLGNQVVTKVNFIIFDYVVGR